MSTDFVRYSPDIETFDPHLEELKAKIIDFWEKTVSESPTREGSGHAVRGAHAKTLGVVRAEVEILGDAPAPYAQGIYAKPGRHGALIRFSMASDHLGPDAHLGPVLGFAIKIFDIDGTKLMEDEPESTTFDLVLKNNPTFIANTAKHYLFIQEIGDRVGDYLARGKTGFRDLLNDYLTGKGTLEQDDWAWEELFAFVKTATQTPVRNPLLSTYWTMAALRHGDFVAKVRVAPAADSAAHAMHLFWNRNLGRAQRAVAHRQVGIRNNPLAQPAPGIARDAHSIDRSQHVVDPGIALGLGEGAPVVGVGQVHEMALARPVGWAAKAFDQKIGQPALAGFHIGRKQRA